MAPTPTCCRWTALALAVVVIAGCGGGPKLAPVRGTVTYQGKPLPRGTITFVPDNPGPAATGEIQPDGGYVLSTGGRPGAVPGSHRVMIVALEDTTDVLPEHRNLLPGLLLPEKYGHYQRSGLTAVVEDWDNAIDFPLR